MGVLIDNRPRRARANAARKRAAPSPWSSAGGKQGEGAAIGRMAVKAADTVRKRRCDANVSMPTSRIPQLLACKLSASRHRARATSFLFVSTTVLLRASSSCVSSFAAPRAERAPRAPQCAARAPAPRDTGDATRARAPRAALSAGWFSPPQPSRCRLVVYCVLFSFSSSFFLVCRSAGGKNTAPPCADGPRRRRRRTTRVRRAECLWR